MDIVNTLKLRVLAALKTPLIAFISPRVIELNRERCVLELPFGWRNKNLMGSMFLGSLATAADTTYGLLFLKIIDETGLKASVTIKEFQSQFLKRVEGNAVFCCSEGVKLRQLLDRAINSTERVEEWIDVIATVPEKNSKDVVAKFRLLVSVKRQKPRNA